MLKKDFWFDLPQELIAQQPADPRDSARLLCLDRATGEMQHRVFRDLVDLLNAGDLLVVNNSKVLPARLIGTKPETGGICELLLLRQVKGDVWECLAKPGKRLRPGQRVTFGDGTLTAAVLETAEDGNKLVEFTYDTQTLYEKLDAFGKMPLPPYITEQLEDQSQYQTVYAKELGSAAAPTAGLHFTPELMDRLRQKGIGIAEVTLHVGLGTFRPVKEADIADHQMHSEWYSVSAETARRIVRGGAMALAEGANMPSTPAAIEVLREGGVLFAPAKAANAGGVAVSGLEMCQNSMRLAWTFDEVDQRLHQIMLDIFHNIYDASVEYGVPGNLLDGANIAGFRKVADAMLAQGVC